MKDKDIISMQLIEVDTKDGIVLCKNEETGLMYFKLFKFDLDGTVSCPDGKSAFSAIEVHPHIVICQLPVLQNASEDIVKFRIYLRKEKEWLKNPQIVKTLEEFVIPSSEEDIKKAINFSKVVLVHSDFLHITCLDDVASDRVYVFKNKHWISVPYSDLGMMHPIVHFEQVYGITFQKKSALRLETKSRINPFSIYFLPELDMENDGEYLSIPDPIGFQDKYKQECVVFRHLFQTYLVFGIGPGFGTNPRHFFVYRLDIQEYIPSEIKDGKLAGENLKFEHEYFTEEYLLVRENTTWIPFSSKDDSGESYFTVISTKTWQPHENIVTCKETTSSVVRPQIENGKLIVRFPMPETLKQTL